MMHPRDLPTSRPASVDAADAIPQPNRTAKTLLPMPQE
jgi:hypothetical protein